MRKIKKNNNININDKAIRKGEIIKEFLGNNFEFFNVLCAINDNNYIYENTNRIIQSIILADERSKSFKEREIIKNRIRLDTALFFKTVQEKFVKNNRAIHNIINMLIAYENIKYYIREKKDFRDSIEQHKQKILDTVFQIKFLEEVDLDEVILPENIINDLKKVLSYLEKNIVNNIKYITDLFNPKTLKQEFIKSFNKEILEYEKTEDKSLEILPEYNLYKAVRIVLNNIKYSTEEYNLEAFTKEEIKKDIKTFKQLNTKLNNAFKNYENLLLKGEENL